MSRIHQSGFMGARSRKKARFRLAMLCCSLLVTGLVPIASAYAAESPADDPDLDQLDRTFDGDGGARTSFEISPPDVAIQANGKIVVAGGSWATPATLARFNSDGSLDVSFGEDGRVSGAVLPAAVIIQPDQKIVIAGWTAGPFDFGLARYNPNGTLDASFDGDGVATTDFFGESPDVASSIALQADGKMVAGGYAGKWDGTATSQGQAAALARYIRMEVSTPPSAATARSQPTHRRLLMWSRTLSFSPMARLLPDAYAYTETDRATPLASIGTTPMEAPTRASAPLVR